MGPWKARRGLAERVWGTSQHRLGQGTAQQVGELALTSETGGDVSRQDTCVWLCRAGYKLGGSAAGRQGLTSHHSSSHPRSPAGPWT